MSSLSEQSLKRLNSSTYCRSFLQHGIRFDGRDFKTRRSLVVKSDVFPKQTHGSSTVNLGETVVAVGVTILTGIPSNESPSYGDIDIEVTSSPILSSKNDRSKSDDCIEVQAALKDLFGRANIIDLNQLCIIEGKHAFRIKLSCLCISHAGNLLDACLLGSVAALLNTKLPNVRVENERVVVEEDKARSIRLEHIPIPVTIGCIEESLLIDPSMEEESYLDGKFIAVIVNDDAPVYISQKNANNGFTRKEYKKVLGMCVEEARKIRSALNWTCS